MPYFVDFSWRAEHPLSAHQVEEWESIIREALGGPGWVVMRQVHGVWHVEEARLARPDPHGGPSTHSDCREVVMDALRKRGKTVGG
ncbi:MAG: hypothetical protein DMF82_21855 [Acidobacteria bacterium]|nr:MAG: hypothetical protein DMF82_21855 [Acidobacteriota bacterium]